VASYFDFKVLEYTLVKRDNIDNAVWKFCFGFISLYYFEAGFGLLTFPCNDVGQKKILFLKVNILVFPLIFLFENVKVLLQIV
jgi:hypothetical protein